MPHCGLRTSFSSGLSRQNLLFPCPCRFFHHSVLCIRLSTEWIRKRMKNSENTPKPPRVKTDPPQDNKPALSIWLDTHAGIACEQGFTKENRGPHVSWAYISIVDLSVCKVTPVILHGVVSPDSPSPGCQSEWIIPCAETLCAADVRDVRGGSVVSLMRVL